ncbi:MAG: MetQ/NlpA family ABC transporter substrate-binding protein [Huintestinicola sp.]
MIVTAPDKADDPAIKALVAELQSPETAAFIKEKYNGAVIPVYGE